jgi:hypothetical protein
VVQNFSGWSPLHFSVRMGWLRLSASKWNWRGQGARALSGEDEEQTTKLLRW